MQWLVYIVLLCMFVSRWTVYAKLPIGVNECVNMCVHGALGCTGGPFGVCPCLPPSVPGTGSKFWTQIGIKHLVKN